MKRSLLSWWCVCLACVCHGEEPLGETQGTEPSITFQANDQTRVELQVSIDGKPMRRYWNEVFDVIFHEADLNGDKILTDDEMRYVPSARAIRLSIGNGFVPPVAGLTSVQQITGGRSTSCDANALATYYQQHAIGMPQVGHGSLPHTLALTSALIDLLDEDHDQAISSRELRSAMERLKKLDTNDDELISATELVPTIIYPGAAGTHAVSTSVSDHVSSSPAAQGTIQWTIQLTDTLTATASDADDALAKTILLWTVPGPLPERLAELQSLLPPTVQPSMDQVEATSAGRRAPKLDFAWLLNAADRDQDKTVSAAELQHWLELQRQINHGQLLVTLLTGGGLFELLDTNHDGGLGPRELRTAWQRLEADGFVQDDHVAMDRTNSITLLIASQGLPESIAIREPIAMEWFRQMDRNEDGDVSRREFTGPREAFDRLDKDHDELLTLDEAASG